MSDQAAGLRAWAAPDSLPLGIIGDPGDDALMQALATLPAPAGRRWQAMRGEYHCLPEAWLLWVDTAQIDVADLYRRIKLVFASTPAIETPDLMLLWLHDVSDRSISGANLNPLNPARARLLDNLSTTLKRFMNVELTRDPARWLSSLPAPYRLDGSE